MMESSHQKKYNTFRQTYPEFVYESYQYDVRPDGLHISFSFVVLDKSGKHPVRFSPSAVVPTRRFLSFDQQEALLDCLVFHIGMAELVSYWKCFCPPTVRILCGSLDDAQVAFWKKLYFNGLGEFFYTNGIRTTLDDFMTIISEGSAHAFQPLSDNLVDNAYLVPVGGGKDSVVTLELLRRSGASVRPLIMNPRGATTSCAAVAGFGEEDTLVIRRSLDPVMLRLNEQGCLNGHTPFSAMLAFYTLLASQLSGVHAVALSNEGSANESTVVGTDVNHQYSKSVEFEDDFRLYVARYMGGRYRYFSMLRPLSELQIAMLFSREKPYHEVFRSCNVGSKQDVWCGHCAKCLFAYIILSPFISPEQLTHIFGKNMLDDEFMRPVLMQLAGGAETKPFECVGTIDEVHAALSMTADRWYASGQRPLPALLHDWQYAAVSISLETLSDGHNLTARELSMLNDALQSACRIEK